MLKKIIVSIVFLAFMGILSLSGFKANAETYPVLNTDLFNGAKISYAAPGDGFAWTKINPQQKDWTGATALAFRVLNATGIDSPLQFSVHETSSEMFATNQDDENGPDRTFFIGLDGTTVEKGVKWGNIWVPANFNGTMIIPLDSFNDLDPNTGDGVIDLANIYALFLGNNIQYNSFEKLFIGEIAIVKDGALTTILNTTSLSSDEFAQAFVNDPDANSQKAVLDRVLLSDILVPAKAQRLGDVKIIESFPYATNDALLSAITTWTAGSQVTLSKYDEDSEQGSAMRVDIGAPIPGNNIYTSINIFPQTHVTDWTVWNDGGQSGTEVAKGITFWVKNLSEKEITINLEFDEFTAGNYGSNNEDFTHERHNIKYGARIMLMDESGNEFIVQSKPTFAIPAGFTGWVRIPFSQYWIPDWCTWGDGVLDLTKPVDGMFLTADTTKNEGLSFVIDSIGVYYNDTEISSLFNTPANSFKNNLGIQ